MGPVGWQEFPYPHDPWMGSFWSDTRKPKRRGPPGRHGFSSLGKTMPRRVWFFFRSRWLLSYRDSWRFLSSQCMNRGNHPSEKIFCHWSPYSHLVSPESQLGKILGSCLCREFLYCRLQNALATSHNRSPNLYTESARNICKCTGITPWDSDKGSSLCNSVSILVWRPGTISSFWIFRRYFYSK